MSGNNEEDHLAYGEYNETSGVERGGTERGLAGDAYRYVRGKYQDYQGSQVPQQNYTNAYQPQLNNQGVTAQSPSSQGYAQDFRPQAGRPNGGQQSGGIVGSLFNKVHGVVQGLGSELAGRVIGLEEKHSHTHTGAQCTDGTHDNTRHRFGSFAAERRGNDVKWYVDGCSYMYAVSKMLGQAQESIWIMDWWLSPELYLRRPPSRNEQYRIDRMLQAAAQRGVKVNIIVYKEVTQALTRKYLSPTLPKYLHSLLPHSTDIVTSALSGMGLAATFMALEHLEGENPLITPPVTVSSSHTKHALEDLHPNISVFRHPDHLPDAQTLQSSFLSSLQNMSLNAATASKLPGDALKAIYGMNDDVVLYWAHHEKLCIIDGSIAFMGGLDLCYGRWDTNQHPIADAHPENLNDIVFPGQDFNNARVMDFQDVANWENNNLDRKDNSRMGWSDISISLRGPVVEDLRAHFVGRWNFIYDEKYDVRKDTRYSRLTFRQNQAGLIPQPQAMPSPMYSSQTHGQQQHTSQQEQSFYPPPPPMQSSQSYNQPQQTFGRTQEQQFYPPPPSLPQPPNHYSPANPEALYFPPPPASARGIDETSESRETPAQLYPERDDLNAPSYEYRGLERPHHLRDLEREASNFGDASRVIKDRLVQRVQHVQDQYLSGNEHYGQLHGHFQEAGMPCQIVRSCTKWSHGIPTEHSIANAYIGVIQASQHFVYIENQFFITATSDEQKPVHNKIGAALVERILRAARAGDKYKVFVVMPAVPAFAGDLKDEASLGTRAIMEFQYNSINRGGHSIMECIANEGYNPTDYIRFYNLRNYDRIHAGASMQMAELDSGINYEDVRREHDNRVDPTSFRSQAGADESRQFSGGENYARYQQAAAGITRADGFSKSRWDSVSECYMLNGPDIREVPWQDGDSREIDAFVSEELYIHSKVLIADDRVVICGSANLNDRSQLGFHDSEIAIIIEDPSALSSTMNGLPFRASKFAASLRRQLFRKHLGLLPPQNMQRADVNFEPVGMPNAYAFGSEEDQAVEDPLSDSFLYLWNTRAKTNTDAFSKIFHPVPDDRVRNWKDYDSFYEEYFCARDAQAGGKNGEKTPAKYRWGHVVRKEFSEGPQGLYEMKELLSTVQGTLVEMPLLFLIEEDIAKEGVSLNAFTEEVYT